MLLEAADRVTRPLRDMAQGSSRAAQALNATRQRLQQLQRSQADISSFRALKAASRATETQLQGAQARVAALARQMSQTANPSRQLTREFDRAKRAAEALKREHREQAQRLQDLRTRLSAAGISTNDLARHERELRAAVGRTNQEMAEQERRLRQITERTRRLAAARERASRIQGNATGLAAGGFAAMQTGQVIARPLIDATGAARDYESVMTDIAQKANLGREEARLMGLGLLVAAKEANQLPEALQAGVDVLAGFGMDPRRAIQMMAPIGRAATAYKAEIADLSAAAFAAVDNLKVPVSETSRVIDAMAAAGKSGAFEIKDMAQYFPQLTAASQALGQKGVRAVADLAAALQIARKGAGDSASAATNVANVLQKISSPATIRAFKKFGIDLPAALKKAYRDGKTPLEAIAELTNKATGGDLGKIGFLFEDAQVQAGLRPLIQNLEEYRKIRADALSAGGTTDTDFAERMKDAAQAEQAMNIAAMELKLTLGEQLLPTAVEVFGALNRGARAMIDWAKANPGFAKGLAIAAAVLAGLFVTLGGGAIIIAGVLAPFAALAFAATALGIGLGAVLAVAAGVVAIFVAIGATAYVIYNNWGAITGFFSGIWESVKSTVSAAFSFISQLFSNFQPVNLLLNPFGLLMSFFRTTMGSQMLEAGANLLRGLVRGILSGLTWVKNAISNVASSVVNWFKSKLGIHSPSRVFRSLGGHMMDGLAIGLDRGARGPLQQVTQLTRDLSAAMAASIAVPAFAADAGGLDRTRDLAGQIRQSVAAGERAGASGQNQADQRAAPAPAMTFNIYAAPGMDESQLAQLVADKVSDALRTSNNRGSSFADRPDWDV